MPAVIDFCYEENKVYVKISYCGFTIFDISKKKKNKTPEEIKAAKEKKALKNKKKAEKKAKKAGKSKKDSASEEKKERSVKDMLELAHSLLNPVKKGMRRLFKGIRITKFYLNIKVGKFDAYECAIAYGKICTAAANALAFFQLFFTIKADHIEIQPGFGTEKNVYTARFRAKISPSAVLAAGFSLAWTYLSEMLRNQQETSYSSNGKNKKEELKHADRK